VVDLPSVRRSLVTTQTPRSPVTGADIAAPGRALANAFEDIGAGLLEVERAARNRQMAQLGLRINADIADMEREHAGNPEGFRLAVKAYGRTLETKESRPSCATSSPT
jgi:hypothetical protein